MERVRDGAYNYKGVSELPAFLICRFLFRAAAASRASYIQQDAGWAMRLLRDVGFSSSQFLRYEPETSGIDVTLLGTNNDIRHKSNSNGIMPN